MPAAWTMYAPSSPANVLVRSESPNRELRIRARVAALAIATFAFWAYTQALLPGVDLGDTGGFQAAVLWPEVSARQAYPLYLNLGSLLIHAVSAANPARGLNLFSALFGAAAVGLLTFVCASIV